MNSIFYEYIFNIFKSVRTSLVFLWEVSEDFTDIAIEHHVF